jgi:coproporphyrinogen III oxidase
MVGNSLQRSQTQEYFQTLQREISTALESIDGKSTFHEDQWTYDPSGERTGRSGGGSTRMLEHGAIFEKAGVNFSAVQSLLTEKLSAQMAVEPQPVFATGVSLVLHPVSPMIPTVHMNLRYLELGNGDAWYGGGMDLTPYYLFADDVKNFHASLKNLCDTYDQEWYPRFKNHCDEYFYLRHRSEARGVGGIFFDYQRDNRETMIKFVKDVGDHFTSIYQPIVERRKYERWGEKEKTWQELRRGRYVEFNLIYDRGTLFGLETEGRVESILMSLPPVVRWEYDFHPERGTREYELLEILRHPRSWV